MSNAYLYIFDSNDFSTKDVTKFLDTLEGVDDWFASIPNSVFIVGSIPARKLSKTLELQFGTHKHFITLISKTARAGWMPKAHWRMLPSKDE